MAKFESMLCGLRVDSLDVGLLRPMGGIAVTHVLAHELTACCRLALERRLRLSYCVKHVTLHIFGNIRDLEKFFGG